MRPLGKLFAVAFVGLAYVVGSAGLVDAAELRLIDQQVFTDESAPSPNQPDGPSWETNASVDPELTTSVLQVTVQTAAAAICNSPPCQASAFAIATARVSVTLDPENDEKPGERVPACLRAERAVAAAAEGKANASGFVGGGDFPIIGGPLTVEVGGKAVVEVAPLAVAVESPPPASDGLELACSRALMVPVGERIALAIGSRSTASAEGVGAAIGEGFGNAILEIRLEECTGDLPTCPSPARPAPLVSHLGLAVLALLLLGLGTLVLVGRRAASD